MIKIFHLHLEFSTFQRANVQSPRWCKIYLSLIINDILITFFQKHTHGGLGPAGFIGANFNILTTNSYLEPLSKADS